MKLILFIIIGTLNLYAQTNVIHISNSIVTINNYTIDHKSTNILHNTNKIYRSVVIMPDVLERLRWETMLEERRKTMFRSYLRKFER